MSANPVPVTLESEAGAPIGTAGNPLIVNSASGGDAVTIANGADVAEGNTADAAVTGDNSGTVNAHLRGLTKTVGDPNDGHAEGDAAGTISAKLRGINEGLWDALTGALPIFSQFLVPQQVKIADNNDSCEGGIGEAAVTGDNSGTISAKLRGVNKLLSDVWDSTLHRIKSVLEFSYSNLASNGTTTVKSGAGVLHSITINTKGVTNTATIYDNTAGSGTKIATIDTTLTQDTLLYDASFSTGLTVVLAGGTSADITVTYL